MTGMFGIIRPCRHRLGEELGSAWRAHLCGVCLSLRDDHGHAARLATNYDGLVVSALVEGQTSASRRPAGPCALRGMRGAPVATGACVRLAATVSLVLAAAKVRDHVTDRDGLIGRYGIRTAARQLAGRWARQGTAAGTELGFDTAVLLDAVDRQAAVEAGGGDLLTVTEPTETATAAAFGHTAVLAGRPANLVPLTEIGRLFGRVAHLLDAVEDLAADTTAGAWNPLSATGTGVAEAHRLCVDAVLGIELALAEVEFADGRLVHRLLRDELRRAIHRTFEHSPGPAPGALTAGYPGGPNGPGQWPQRPGGPGGFPQQPGGVPQQPGGFPQQPGFPHQGPGWPQQGGYPGPGQPGGPQWMPPGPEYVGSDGPPPRRGGGGCCLACSCCDCCEGACECCECCECCDGCN